MKIQTTRFLFLPLQLARILIHILNEIPSAIKRAATLLVGVVWYKSFKNSLASNRFTFGTKIH